MTDADLEAVLGFTPSAEQVAAIKAPLRPALVHAGAGTGKTTVMAARVAWLVASGQVAPENVLGLTFTRKAAGELADRVRGFLPDVDAAPSVSTYHAFARDLLLAHGVRLGVDARPEVLDEPSCFQLARRIVTRLDVTDLDWHGSADTLTRAVVALDGELAEHLCEPQAIAPFLDQLEAEVLAAPKLTNNLREVLDRVGSRRTVADLVIRYRDAKRQLGRFDFGDYMRLGAAVAELPEVAATLRAESRVVLLDEYQDTSYAQEQLLLRLFGAGHPIMAVGDPYQSIYGFRGASAANLDRFRREFGDDVLWFPLTENRRSQQAIVTAANQITLDLRGAGEPELVALPDAAQGSVTVALLEREADEVDWVADRVAAYLDAVSLDDGKPHRAAVLCRTRGSFPDIYRSLTSRGIPVEVVGLGGLLEVPEVAEVVAVLRVLADPAANPSLLRLLRGPKWRIGQRDLRLLADRAKQLAGSGGPRPAQFEQIMARQCDETDPVEVVALLDALEDPGDAPYDPAAISRFAELADLLRQLRRLVGLPLGDLVHRITLLFGLEAEASLGPAARSRRSALARFVEKVGQFEPLDGPATIPALLGWFDLHSGREDELEPDQPEDGTAVQLMTIHSAKGLEFEFVAIPFVSKGRFPVSTTGTRGTRWPTGPSRLPTPLRGDRSELPAWTEKSQKGLDRFKAEAAAHEEREERRLMYVAVTRARDELCVCGSWWGPTQKQPRGPSAFLDQLATKSRIDVWTDQPDQTVNPHLTEPPDLLPSGDGTSPTRVAAAALVRSFMRGSGESLGMIRPVAPVDPAKVARWDELAAALLEAERRQREPVRLVRLPELLSTSQVLELARDEAEFAARLDRPLPRLVNEPASLGTAFHAWVAAHYQSAALIDPEDLSGSMDDSDAGLPDLIRAFRSSSYADRAPVAVEAPVSIRLGGRTVVGRIDAVFRDGARWEVIDWKTGSRGSDPMQLGIYRLAWAEANGIDPADVVGRFVYIATGEVEELDDPVSRSRLEAMLGGG